MLKDNIMQLRQFPPFDPELYRVIPVALPVDIYECSANIKAESDLDALAEAVLKLIDINFTGNKEISGLLYISEDIVQYIKESKLLGNGFITEKPYALTKYGKDYLNNIFADVFIEEKVFGNMFVNKADGEIMPYFYKGTLPSSRRNFDGIAKVLLPGYKSEQKNKAKTNSIKFSDSYEKYFKIQKCSDAKLDQVINEFELLKTGYIDVLYSEVSNQDKLNPKTFAEAEEEKQGSRSYVKVFEDPIKELYLYSQIIVSKDNPEEFLLLSPFAYNITTWYNKRLPYLSLKDNGIEILSDGKKYNFGEFLRDITEEFYIEFPELKSNDFEWYLKTNFPTLNKTKSLNIEIRNLIKSYYDLCLLQEGGKVTHSSVINEAGRLVEAILSCYITMIPNRNNIIDNVLIVPYVQQKYNEIFDKFGICNCAAKKSAENVVKRMRYWRDGKICGESAPQKYFFLILEAYLIGRNPFAKVLKKHGEYIVKKIDDISYIRNNFGSHSDGIGDKKLEENEFTIFKENVLEVAMILTNALYEHEEDK